MKKIISIFSSSDAFPYTAHMTVAFGYCEAIGYIGSYINQYTFIKFFDGHTSRGKVYVCWDMLENSEYYLDTPINVTMTALRPN